MWSVCGPEEGLSAANKESENTENNATKIEHTFV
jgi:hypothetical protein